MARDSLGRQGYRRARVRRQRRVDRRRHDARDQEHGGERPGRGAGRQLVDAWCAPVRARQPGLGAHDAQLARLQVFPRLGKQNFSSKALGGVERVVYNSLEHAPAFLMLMWLHRILVDADQAGYLGMVYVAHRFVYGIFFRRWGSSLSCASHAPSLGMR